MYTRIRVHVDARVWYAFIEIYLLGLFAKLFAGSQANEDNYTPRYSLCYNVILYLLNKDSN